MPYLIDTDIIIYATKRIPSVVAWFEKTRESPKAISLITYGELVYGAKKSAHPERNLITVNRIREIYPIVELNAGIMDLFGDLKSRLEKSGKKLEDFDLLIAATVLYYDMTLVTNNAKHFARIKELRLENCFSK